jgi:sugar phosphate isomerase/epimerase
VIHAAPNLFQPTSLDHREQDQWLRNTKRSIDFAHQVGARILICHLGSVAFFWFNPASKIRHYLRSQRRTSYADDECYAKLKSRALEKIRKRMPPYMEAMRKALDCVLDYAKERGVTLGFENREKFDELPLDADFPQFLASFPEGAPVGYWHDAGHARLKEHMLLLEHKRHLQENASRLLGFHLHDVSSHWQDHQPIGTGVVDFEMLSSFWRPEHTLVLELSPRLSPEEVLSSKKRVESLLAVQSQ